MSEKVWDYRIVRSVKGDGTDADWYSIQEVYYDDDGKPNAQSIDLQVEGEDNNEMKIQLEDMMSAIDKPILNERDIVSSPDKKAANQFNNHNINNLNVVDEMMKSVGNTTTNQLNQSTDEMEKIRQRNLSLEIENADLKDMLREQGVDVV